MDSDQQGYEEAEERGQHTCLAFCPYPECSGICVLSKHRGGFHMCSMNYEHMWEDMMFFRIRLADGRVIWSFGGI